MRILVAVLKIFNGAYFVGLQGILICACISRTGVDLRNASPLRMNEL